METESSSPTPSRNADADFKAAAAILDERGFADVAIMSILQGKIFEVQGVSDGLLAELQAQYGEPNQMVYSEFEPDTGRQIPSSNLAAYARSASPCLKNGRPWRDCQLNYQPVDGCFLEAEPLRFCKTEARKLDGNGLLPGGTPSQCWNYEKGPGVMLPYQAETKSEIDLAKVKVVKAAAPAPAATPASEAKPKPRQTRVNTMGRPSCKHGYANGPVFDPFG
ncbi:hypothetical protein PGB28_18710 [Primorskyibacter aestuariivivens]|uniref:hypothetical protein n=1 Tax=Primorskyibacter aestuariivivens TaxID=1888912 RepID=UPI0023002A33|nr:hypothetical protein [Primorskyibacter aestuariivivens]MDA7430497.1 hypothetical protein [Primorskyibacter aestuariivivens]